jgi:hypothetical protein
MSTMSLAFVAGLILFGAIFGLIVPVTWRRRQYFSSLTCLLSGMLLFLSAAVIVLVSVGIKGYQALTHEELAATVFITPLGSQQFQARIVRPHTADTLLTIAGDEFYIDARILKWKPFTNLLGVHTFYRLDRVSGRYRDITDETTKLRTLYSLAGPLPAWDLFSLTNRYTFLAPLLDAQYGSASFVSAKDAQVLKVMVSTSGLLIRTGESSRSR